MKKTYKRVLGLLIAAMFFLNACGEDFLDALPKGLLIPETTDDYRKLLDLVPQTSVNATSIMRTTGIANILADDYQIADSSGYHMALDSDLWEIFTWAEPGYLVMDDQEDFDWKTMYELIHITNTVIDGVPNASGPENEKEQLLAEAKVHRAFCYLNLVNIYAKHYSRTADTDLGVPLLLEDLSLTTSLRRASVQRVYDQIIKDLTDAYPHLPNVPRYNFRPSIPATYGLLARTYLYKGNYEKALNYADKVLAIIDFLYDYNEELDTNYHMNLDSWYDKEIILKKTTSTRTAGGFNYHFNRYFSSTTLVASVFDTINDLRFHNKFEVMGEDDRCDYREIPNRWGGGFHYYPIIGVTTPEILLTSAECEARIGEIARAMDIVNRIREKRYKTPTYTPLTATNREQAVQHVLHERRRELWGRGLRWFDLKRLNAIEGANISITRTFTGHTLAPGDRGWVMPIAGLYIGLNPEIEQNPGY